MKSSAPASYIVTVSEARRLLGLRESSFAQLERAAGIAANSRRSGYTDREFRALVDTLRESLNKAERTR